MTFLEKAQQAQEAQRMRDDQQESAGVEALRQAVSQIVPLDRIALMLADNPERARNELRAACRRLRTQQPWASIDEALYATHVETLIATVFGLGPLEALINDEAVTEIMVNGTSSVFVERGGRLRSVPVRFESEDQVRALIDRILGPLGRRIDESSPLANARLPQGHRVNAVLPPLAVDGPLLTIRAFRQKVFSLDELAEMGSFDKSVKQFLVWAVKARKSMAVSGGTGSGKTTLLNALSCHISHEERVITIEDSAELKFEEHPHVARMEARERNAEGVGEVTIRDLVVNALRMRPDRIIVGECRSAEAIDMLQAMNTGHDGSLTTLHANSPQEAVDRLVTMVRFAVDLPLDAIEAQIGNAFDLVVQTTRLPGGARCVAEIASMAFHTKKRRCVLETHYRRGPGMKKGRWLSVPTWTKELPLAGIAKKKEVKRWKRQLGLPS